MSAARTPRTLPTVCLRFVFLAGLLAAGCGGEPDVDSRMPATVVTLPPSPPLCDKNPAELLLFVHYSSSNCGGDVCFPPCGGPSDCPAGAQCDVGSSVCRALDCSAELQSPPAGGSVCTGDTICNPDPGGASASCGLPPTCADDDQCPCGSYCDPQSHRCSLDCLTGPGSGNIALGCNGTLQCDTRGRCSNPAGIQLATQVATLDVSPTVLPVPYDAARHFSLVKLTIQLSTSNPSVGQQPTPALTVSAPAAVSLACAGDQPLQPGHCSIAPGKFQLQGAGYLATQQVQVQVADGNQDAGWNIVVSAAGLPQPTVVSAVPQAPAAQDGRYSGLLNLDGGATLPIWATVTDGAIELHDAAHVIAPTGTILLDVNGDQTATSFLAGRGTTSLYQKDTAQFVLTTPAPKVDPVSGQLSGSFTMSLATSPSQAWQASFTVTRVADLVTAGPCPDGESFDPAVQACIPGIPWDGTAAGAPSFLHARATGWLDAMVPRLADPLLHADGAEPLAERLLCLDATAATNPGFTKLTKGGGLSGDLECGDPTSPHNMWGVGLISYADRANPSAPTTQFDMLAQCVQQISADAPATLPGPFANDSCVSLARFYPALFSVAGAAPYQYESLPSGAAFDQRSRLLFLRLLQQWSQLAGFIARNGAQQRAVADILTQLSLDPAGPEQSLLNATPPGLSYGALLDAVESAWTVLLDRRIQQPLLALPAHALAAPDYRQLQKPLAYWTFANADRAPGQIKDIGSGPPLTASAGCTYPNADVLTGSSSCVHQASLPHLDQNVTLAANIVPYDPASGTSTVVDSDGFVVKYVSTASGWVLAVGHRIADGTTSLVSFPVTYPGRVLLVQRDAATMTYRVWMPMDQVRGGATTQELTMLQARYTAPPALLADTLYVGAGRASSADYLKGTLKQFALWDSALSPTEMAKLDSIYEQYWQVNFLPADASTDHPLWPSEVVLPQPSDPNANEAAVGLPVSLLEGLIGTMGLIEAYLDDAALANPSACRRGYVDDGFLRARDRAARTLRVAAAVQSIAETLYARAAKQGVTWQNRYDLALSELQGARNHAIQVLGDAAACQNPMGLGPKEFPLYFGDSRSLLDPGSSALNVIEASATYLLGKAKDANTQASNALDKARAAWKDQYTSGVQQTLANQGPQQRLDDIRSGFGKQLVDLCGLPLDSNQNEIDALDRFLASGSGTGTQLTAQNCFAVETPACAGTAAMALSKVDPGCVRGQIGEALVASEAARQRVVQATVARKTAVDQADAAYEHCAQKQAFDDQTKDIIDALDALEKQEAASQADLSLLSNFCGLVGGAVTGNAGGTFSGLLGLAGIGSNLSFADEKADQQALLEKRKLDGDLMDCWFDAEKARAPLDEAEQAIVVANSDLQTSLAHVQTLEQSVSAVVVEAKAAIARESQRPVPGIAFHYWADEAASLYTISLERARRMTYLALRAVEHDLQRDFGLDHDVLAARHPAQLTSIVDDKLAAYLGEGIDKLVATQHPIVLSLCNDILRLPERNGEHDCDTGRKSQQQFREILLSPANALYENGVYVGQAIPFTLDARQAGVGQRCAENLAQVDARFVADNIQTPLKVELEKRETFYSTVCNTHQAEVGSTTQDGTLRSSNNLLLDGTTPQFGQDRTFTPALIDAVKDDNGDFENSDRPGPNAVPDLAGRGVYGDYRFIVLSSSLSTIVADSGDLRDLKIRLDYISVADTPGTLPPPTSPLTVQMCDGNGQTISGPDSVSATCDGGAPNCLRDALAQLTANPAAGWHFADWSGACAGPIASCSVKMTGPRQVFATFVNDDHVTLAVDQSGDGSGGVAAGWVSVAPGTDGGGPNLPWQEQLPRNSTVVLTASPAFDSAFTGWSGDCTGSSPTCTVTLASSRSVSARFDRKHTMTVQLAVDTNGQPYDNSGFEVDAKAAVTSLVCFDKCFNGAPASCTTSCGKAFLPTETVAVTQGVSGQYAFVGWSGDCTGTGSCNLGMSADHHVVANYKPLNHVAVSVSTGGAVVAAPQINCGNGQTACSGSYPPGTPVTFTAVPASGYRLTGWSNAASSCGSSTQCTIVVSGLGEQVTATFGVAPVCTPGATQSCCDCAGRGHCCERGHEVCSASGQWGSCGGSVCVGPGQQCN